MTLLVYCMFFFADDTNIFFNGKYVSKLVEIMQLELSKLYHWLQVIKWTLNLTKTHFMVFHRAKHKIYKITIKHNSIPIQQVSHTIFYG